MGGLRLPYGRGSDWTVAIMDLAFDHRVVFHLLWAVPALAGV